ncbi:hypothetical protein [Spirillospora sp. NPDC029432]|uniref:hypothetical protein n=1 Tax=Spirillospora sp. NPDC029432 TaxID=3154599 RepID=UPI0034560554
MGERGGTGAEIRIIGAELADGLELRTRGLAARGRPELRVSGLPPYLGQGWARVLGLLAQRLAALDPAAPVPAELDLAPEVTIALPAEDGDLVPAPPASRAPAPDWHRDVLLALFPSAHS